MQITFASNFVNLVQKYQGPISTFVITTFAVFLTLWSKSTLYLLSPLWFVPLFVLRSPRSDRRTLQLFILVEPIFRITEISKQIRKLLDKALIPFLLIVYIILAVDFFQGDTRPSSWIPLLGFALLGFFLSGLISAAVILVLGFSALALQVICMIIVSVGIRILAIATTLYTHFSYTSGRMYMNYKKIIFHDGLVANLEIAPKVGVYLPQYSRKNFSDCIDKTVEEIYEHSSNHGDGRTKLVIGFFLSFYYLGSLASIYLPSLIPRICTKLSFIPLCVIFTQPKHMTSPLRGEALFREIRGDRVPLLFAIALLIFLALICITEFLVAAQYINLQGRALLALQVCTELFFEKYRWIFIILTCSSTLAAYFVSIWLLMDQNSLLRNSVWEIFVRLMGIIRIIYSTISVISIMLSKQTTEAFFSLLNVIF